MGKRVETDLLTYSRGGFPALALVSERYRVAKGLLHHVGNDVKRTYMPFSEPGLPTALARISSEEVTPLEFASVYGELGFSRLVRRALSPEFSACLPKTDEWKMAHAGYRGYRDAIWAACRGLPEGDPLDWLMAHSRTVALCLQFIGLLESGDEMAIREEVECIQAHKPYAKRAQLIRLPVREWRESLKRHSASVIIRPQLCHLITENIAGVRREFITDPFNSHADSFFFGSTIEAVYWQIADKMEAKMVRRCDECHRFFVARDKRQRYCPALPGSTRSRCSSRLNVNNHRERRG
jgi:hypothetical protein